MKLNHNRDLLQKKILDAVTNLDCHEPNVPGAWLEIRRRVNRVRRKY